MGGLAFATSGPGGTPLNVSRMPPAVYMTMASKIQAKLETIFRNVTIPRDAPGKIDYGDIDFLVEGALCAWTPALIQTAIGATHRIGHGGTISYAVPYTDSPDQYVQVDVEVSPGNGTPDSAELFQWTRFMKSDADLLQIIGICHRSLGITCNDRGLHVRIEQIEPYDKKKALLYLTRNPDEALEFYGLDKIEYRGGFQNEHELFEWVSKGRFFNRQIFQSREEKSNDRQRQRKRHMYNRFVEEYMLSDPETGKQDRLWTREEVLEEALHMYAKHDEYQAMIKEHTLREKDNAIWQRVRDILPLEGKSLGTALKGLKRWVNFKEGQPFITSEAMITDQPLWALAVSDEDRVLAWVSQNWAEVKSLEKARAVSLENSHRNKTSTSNLVA